MISLPRWKREHLCVCVRECVLVPSQMLRLCVRNCYVAFTFHHIILFQTEIPVPEQFKTVWDGKKLVTTATEIAG